MSSLWEVLFVVSCVIFDENRSSQHQGLTGGLARGGGGGGHGIDFDLILLRALEHCREGREFLSMFEENVT